MFGTENDIEYSVVKSARKTLSLEIKGEALVVRAPFSASDKRIAAFVHENRNWIEKHLNRAHEQQKRASEQGMLSAEELRALAERAKRHIPERAAHYARLMGVSYGRITIRNQRTKWGSCTREGNLNFNCLLMLCPDEVIDSVVVHELCHLKQMNHSEKFYKELLAVFPDYKKWNGWLKKNGGVLLRRMTGSPSD